jgi:hypothetical protein
VNRHHQTQPPYPVVTSGRAESRARRGLARILPALALGLALGGGGGCSRQVRLADVTQATNLTLTADFLPTSIELVARGQLDGRATLAVPPIATQVLEGRFNVRLAGDWYDTNCVVHYTPTTGTRGQVTIRYRFRGL